MLIALIVIALPALIALPFHFGRDTAPARFEVARDSAGRAIAVLAVDPHTERTTVVRALP